jgi:hypothetical protein
LHEEIADSELFNGSNFVLRMHVDLEPELAAEDGKFKEVIVVVFDSC